MKIRFNFDKAFKLYDACAEDEIRPAMEMVHFKDGAAYASDSHILIRVPLVSCMEGLEQEDREKLNGFSIHGKILKLIYGFDMIEIIRDEEADTCCIRAKKDKFNIDFWLQKTSEVGAPDFDKVLNEKHEEEQTSKIGINAKLLYRLSKAVNINNIAMKIYSSRTGILIHDEMTGVDALIMPFMVTE